MDRTKIVLCVLSLAIIIVAFYMFVHQEYDKRIRIKEQELTVLKAEITKGQVIAAKHDEFKSEVERLESRFQTALRILPEKKETDNLLRNIQNLAALSDLQINKFNPQDFDPMEFYAEYPIVIDITGSYPNLTAFFNKIGKFTRIININNLTIKSLQNPTENRTIQANYIATTFVFLDQKKEE